MKKNNEVSMISKKIDKVSKSIKKLKVESDVAEVLNEMLDLVVQIEKEMSMMKAHSIEIENDICDIEERVDDIENFLEAAGEIEPAYIECPYCQSDIELDEEFYEAEEFKLVCKSCNKEVEVITQYCDGIADGCDCEGENCDCCSEEENKK